MNTTPHKSRLIVIGILGLLIAEVAGYVLSHQERFPIMKDDFWGFNTVLIMLVGIVMCALSIIIRSEL